MTVRPVADTIRLAQDEIARNIERAGALLDAYAQDEEAEVPPWERCRESLDEVRGALLMLDIQGAQRLCDELLATLDALERGRILSRDQGLDLLLYGLLMLPRYLDRSRYRRRELPDSLLPTLNALREQRCIVAFPEYQFSDFDDVDLTLPALARPGASPPDDSVAARTRRMRHILQSGLLGLFHTPESPLNGRKIRHALGRLETAWGDTVSGRWLRLAALVAERLLAEAGATDTSVRLMLARLDRFIADLQRHPGETLGQPPQPLVRSALLHYCVVCGEHDEELGRLRDALGLPRDITRPTLLEEESEALKAPDHDVLEAVGKAVGDDLDRLRDIVETLSRLESMTDTERDTLGDQLQALIHVLVLLGLTEDADRLKREHSRLRAAGSTATPDDVRELFQGLADALSLVEESVQSLPTAIWHDSARIRPHRLRDAERRALGECMTILGRVRHALEFLNGDTDEGEDLVVVDAPLHHVAGSLQMIERPEAANLVEAARRVIARLKPEHEGSEELSTLADALAAVEWYLEGLLEDSDNGRDALEIGIQAMSSLESRWPRASGGAGHAPLPDHPSPP